MLKALKTINQIKKQGLIKDYAITGGYALNYYLEPRVTYDLDVFILIDTEDDFHLLYQYLSHKGYKIENVFIFIDEIPVQFFPTYIHPLFGEALRRAKRITVRKVVTKVLTVEYLIATKLFSFRPIDKADIISLLRLANRKILYNIIRRFSNESTPLDKRFKEILGSI